MGSKGRRGGGDFNTACGTSCCDTYKKVTSKYAHIIHLNKIGEEGRWGGEIQIDKTR